MATVSNLRKMLSWHLVGYDGFSNSIKDVPQTGVLLPLHYSEIQDFDLVSVTGLGPKPDHIGVNIL